MTKHVRIQVTLKEDGLTTGYRKFVYKVPEDHLDWDDLGGYILDDIRTVTDPETVPFEA